MNKHVRKHGHEWVTQISPPMGWRGSMPSELRYSGWWPHLEAPVWAFFRKQVLVREEIGSCLTLVYQNQCPKHPFLLANRGKKEGQKGSPDSKMGQNTSPGPGMPSVWPMHLPGAPNVLKRLPGKLKVYKTCIYDRPHTDDVF